MSEFNISSSNNSTSFTIPKLCDDGSNWADYQPHFMNAAGAKGLKKYLEGHARQPTPLKQNAAGVFLKRGSQTIATEEEIEAAEDRIEAYDRAESFAKHIILSSASTRLASKIKSIPTASAMWTVVTDDVKNKSSLQKINMLRLLQEMELQESSDPAAHVAEMEEHF